MGEVELWLNGERRKMDGRGLTPTVSLTREIGCLGMYIVLARRAGNTQEVLEAEQLMEEAVDRYLLLQANHGFNPREYSGTH